MAESSDQNLSSNRRINFLLSCFGSSPKVRRQKNPATARPDRPVRPIWFRFKKTSATVPVDAAVPEILKSCDDKASISPGFKNPQITSIPPAVRTEIIETKDRIRFDSTAETISPAKRTAESLHSADFPSRRLNRQKDMKKTSYPLPAVETAAPASKPPARKLEAAIVIVAVAIVVLWGRIGAILCITALLCLCRRLRSEFKS